MEADWPPEAVAGLAAPPAALVPAAAEAEVAAEADGDAFALC